MKSCELLLIAVNSCVVLLIIVKFCSFLWIIVSSCWFLGVLLTPVTPVNYCKALSIAVNSYLHLRPCSWVIELLGRSCQRPVRYYSALSVLFSLQLLVLDRGLQRIRKILNHNLRINIPSEHLINWYNNNYCLIPAPDVC